MTNPKAPEIATTVNTYSWHLWKKIVGTSGILSDYYKDEFSYESDLYTSIFRLALIAAYKEFDLGAINELSRIDVVWVSKLRTPIPIYGINTRKVNPSELRLLAEIEMSGKEQVAVKRLYEFDKRIQERGLPEVWKVLITWRQVEAWRNQLLSPIRSSRGRWLIITESPPRAGPWLQYHHGRGAFDSAPIRLPEGV